jgi:GNAT superfamily N-acetyltransferase
MVDAPTVEFERVSSARPTPLLTTAIESLNLDELKPILPIHYKELSEHLKHDIPLDPDYQKYLAAQQRGELLYVTLRQSGLLVGYFIGLFGPALHYRTCNSLILDIFYVTPEARGNKGGQTLLSAVKKEWIRRHGKVWTMGMKEEHRLFMEPLLKSFGFKPFETHVVLWAD